MSQMERTSKEFDKNQILLNLRRACDPRCYEAETEILKDIKGVKSTHGVPCKKMVAVKQVNRCELYFNPCQMWSNGQCIFPGSALSLKDIPKPNFRKHRGR